jgi:hypothetical protein
MHICLHSKPCDGISGWYTRLPAYSTWAVINMWALLSGTSVSSFGMKMRIGLVLLSYLASANCLPNGETFARKAESYLGNCLVLSVVKV